MKANFWALFGLFAVVNFFGLWIGGFATMEGVISDWYIGLDQAPWTPPGWVFGAAWTAIGFTFAAFLASYYNTYDYNTGMNMLFASSWGLNVGWNYLFFELHWVWLSALVITDLTLTILLMIHISRTELGWKKAVWGLPYFAWLCIATSLNLYIAIQN